MPHDISIFFKAVDFANKAHFNALLPLGQRRKSSTDPYIVHPMRVGYLALDAGLSVNACAAAILHDVPEDTLVTMDEIYDEFPIETGNIVKLLTKWWGDSSTADEKLANNAIYYSGIMTNQDAINIKLLDRVDNLRDMLLLLPKQTRWVQKYTAKTDKEFGGMYAASNNTVIQTLFNGTVSLVKQRLAELDRR
jgi:(p)ppGpp synthase/HD superfamily hydrolase